MSFFYFCAFVPWLCVCLACMSWVISVVQCCSGHQVFCFNMVVGKKNGLNDWYTQPEHDLLSPAKIQRRGEGAALDAKGLLNKGAAARVQKSSILRGKKIDGLMLDGHWFEGLSEEIEETAWTLLQGSAWTLSQMPFLRSHGIPYVYWLVMYVHFESQVTATTRGKISA